MSHDTVSFVYRWLLKKRLEAEKNSTRQFYLKIVLFFFFFFLKMLKHPIVQNSACVLHCFVRLPLSTHVKGRKRRKCPTKYDVIKREQREKVKNERLVSNKKKGKKRFKRHLARTSPSYSCNVQLLLL